MHVLIDLVNGDDFVVASEKKTSKKKKKEEIVNDNRRDLQKQVININGEIVTVLE